MSRLGVVAILLAAAAVTGLSMILPEAGASAGPCATATTRC
ncbi:hypothetical protein [Nonomuraea sp. SYSU D8015]|nr:hypothetical protein [Nonomuraea sp. SYSU D8015]